MIIVIIVIIDSIQATIRNDPTFYHQHFYWFVRCVCQIAKGRGCKPVTPLTMRISPFKTPKITMAPGSPLGAQT